MTSVTSGGTSKEKKKEELPKVEYSNLPRAIIEQATMNHIAIVKVGCFCVGKNAFSK